MGSQGYKSVLLVEPGAAGWALGHLYSTSKGKHKGGFRF